MFGAHKVFRHLPCALWQFVYICAPRDTILCMKTRHIVLQYIQRHSKDRRNILRYKMDARLLCQFVVFTSAHSFLEAIKSGLMVVQRTQSLVPPLPRAARLGWLWQLNWAFFGCDLRCLSGYLFVTPSHLTCWSNSGIRSLLLVKIAGLSRLGGETHLVFRVSRVIMALIYMWELTNTRFPLVLPASVVFLFKWSQVIPFQVISSDCLTEYLLCC